MFLMNVVHCDNECFDGTRTELMSQDKCENARVFCIIVKMGYQCLIFLILHVGFVFGVLV